MTSYTDIKDIKTYNPKDVSDQVLKDDFRIACAWACRLIAGKSLIHSTEDVNKIGKLILKEFKKRGIETHPDKMKACSRKFLMQLDNSHSTVVLTSDNSEEGLYLVSPHAEWIANKEKSLIVKAKRFAVKDKTFVLCDKDSAHGHISFASSPQKINLSSFKKLAAKHKISDDERKEWWPRRRTFYSYPFSFKPFAKKRSISVKPGTQTFIKSVAYIDSILANTGSSGVELGDEIFLNDVLSKFNSFYIRKPFVYLVGGLPNNGSTKGDIDILIDAEPDKDRDLAIHFRLYRMLPKEWWHRLNIMYSKPKSRGPFTNHIPLFNIMMERVGDSSIINMSVNDAITPFKKYKAVKPTHGRHKGEVYSPETVLKVIQESPEWSEALKKGIIVEQKYDGVRVSIHKVGDKIKSITEDGGDVTKNMPSIIESISKIDHDFIAEGEVELNLDGKHQHRSVTAGTLHTKKPSPDEGDLDITFYDILWYDGKPIYETEFAERFKLLKMFKANNLHVSKQYIAKTESQLLDLIDKVRKLPGSEGAMLKLKTYKYELDGSTKNMLKFKNEIDLDVKIVKKHAVKGSDDTFRYDCIVGEDTYVGRTFNTNITSPTGIVRVAFVDFFEYEDTKTGKTFFSWVFPRVIEAREDKTRPDSLDTARQLSKQLGAEVRKKRLPYTDANPYLMLPNPNDKFDFIIQRHYRGESSHLDMRIDTERKFGIDDPQYSILGWTMLDSVAGRVDEPVTTISKAKEFDNKNIWKIDWDKGIFKTHKQIKSITPEDTPGYAKLSDDDERTQIESVKKSVHPTAWMSYKGVIDKPEPGEPVPAGATKGFPGVLTIIESGKIEWGCNKPYYHEYFVDGKHLKGRLSFRQLERTVDGKKQLWWTCIQPEDQTPYALSARAVKKEWLPPKGHSALPESIRKKIPKDLQYWTMSHKAALEARKKIVEEIKHGRIVVDCGCTDNKRIDKPELEIDFKLQKQTWKGPTVIRAKPSRTEYHLLLKMPSKYIDFVSEEYPENSFIAIKETAHVLRWRTTGELSPKHKLNKTKATPSKISIVDSGKAQLVLDGDNQKMILTLEGKELKGKLTAIRQGPKTDMWDMELI